VASNEAKPEKEMVRTICLGPSSVVPDEEFEEPVDEDDYPRIDDQYDTWQEKTGQ
jgi:hypothetical protein